MISRFFAIYLHEALNILTRIRTFHRLVFHSNTNPCPSLNGHQEIIMIQAVSFVGKSNSGKTTLIAQVIPELKKRGFKIAVIKHAHHGFEIDQKGKDSDIYRESGADGVMLASPYGMALMKPFSKEKPLDELLDYFQDMDLVIVEGYKRSHLPKIEVFRKEKHERPLTNTLENLIAIVTDDEIVTDLPFFSPHNIQGITDFIVQRFLS